MIDGLPDFHAGDFETAADLQAIVDFLRGRRLVAPKGSGLRVRQSSTGDLIEPERSPGFWGKVVTHVTGGQYTYERHPDAASGGWGAAVIESGTCYNVDGNSSVPLNTYHWMERAPGQPEPRFKFAACP